MLRVGFQCYNLRIGPSLCQISGFYAKCKMERWKPGCSDVCVFGLQVFIEVSLLDVRHLFTCMLPFFDAMSEASLHSRKVETGESLCARHRGVNEEPLEHPFEVSCIAWLSACSQGVRERVILYSEMFGKITELADKLSQTKLNNSSSYFELVHFELSIHCRVMLSL